MLGQSFDLALVIPAFNEENRLPKTLESVLPFLDQQHFTTEIIIVDDGSSDQTLAVSNKYLRSDNKVCLRVIKHQHNQGKGAAIKTGVFNARSEYILIYDADGATPIQEVLKVWSIKDTGTIVIGSRALCADGVKIKTRALRKLLGRVFNFAANLIVIPKIKDTQCGFKLIPTEVARKIFSRVTMNGYCFDVEVLFLGKKLGFKIVETPIDWFHVSGSKVDVIKDGIKMFFDLFRIRWRHKNL
jgi:dolichyl-phosphate beta-glucosyltransferase